MSEVTIRLTSYNMGVMDEASEEDYDVWVAYVSEQLGRSPLYQTVFVDWYPWAEGPETDTITGATEDQEEELRSVLRSLWREWCAKGMSIRRE